MARTGKVYTVSYHIGNGHNREGINCAFCHSVETVRMMNKEMVISAVTHWRSRSRWVPSALSFIIPTTARWNTIPQPAIRT